MRVNPSVPAMSSPFGTGSIGTRGYTSARVAASRDHRCVVNQTLEAFSEGKRLKNEGFPGRRSRETVVQAAKDQVGDPYALFTDNCEHLVNEVHGLRKSSPQLQMAAFAGLALVALVALVALLRKRPVA